MLRKKRKRNKMLSVLLVVFLITQILGGVLFMSPLQEAQADSVETWTIDNNFALFQKPAIIKL